MPADCATTRQLSASVRSISTCSTGTSSMFIAAVRVEQILHEGLAVPIIGYDDIRACPDEARTLPFIHPRAVDFIAGNGNRNSAGPLDLFDFHKAVTKGEQLFS